MRRSTGSIRQSLLVWAITCSLTLTVIGVLWYRHRVFGAPSLGFSIGRTPDELLPCVQESRSGVDLATTTTNDFPEFLGPGRHAAIASIELDPDWKTHPPRLVWRNPIGAGWSAFSVVNGFAVTMEQRGEDEQDHDPVHLAPGAHHMHGEKDGDGVVQPAHFLVLLDAAQAVEAGLDPLGELDLLLGIEERHLADLAQVVADRVRGGPGRRDLARLGGLLLLVVGFDDNDDDFFSFSFTVVVVVVLSLVLLLSFLLSLNSS